MEYGHVGTSHRQGSQGGKGYAVGPYISELSINVNVYPTILIHARVPDTFPLGAISELSDFCASRFFNKFRVFSGLEYSDSPRRHHFIRNSSKQIFDSEMWLTQVKINRHGRVPGWKISFWVSLEYAPFLRCVAAFNGSNKIIVFFGARRTANGMIWPGRKASLSLAYG
ncbi:MAG TPA: hypothetical protein VMI32_05785 [Candidatus Solibacter sp.]|nr:hypothetical protein [Candidatus Solibacter sp.]